MTWRSKTAQLQVFRSLLKGKICCFKYTTKVLNEQKGSVQVRTAACKAVIAVVSSVYYTYIVLVVQYKLSHVMKHIRSTQFLVSTWQNVKKMHVRNTYGFYKHLEKDRKLILYVVYEILGHTVPFQYVHAAELG